MQLSILKTLARLSFLLEISTGGKLQTEWCFFSASLVITVQKIQKISRGFQTKHFTVAQMLPVYGFCRCNSCVEQKSCMHIHYINMQSEPVQAKRVKERREEQIALVQKSLYVS